VKNKHEVLNFIFFLYTILLTLMAWSRKPMSEGMENRRRESRYHVNTVVTVNEQLAMVKDLSLGGMRVTAINLKPQQLVDVTIKKGEHDIPMKALVRWVKRAFPFESYCECGLTLISVPSSYQAFHHEITVIPHFTQRNNLLPLSAFLLTLAMILVVLT
jgi:hypothetical protein